MWFHTEVLFSRVVSSIAWQLILQSVIVQAFLFICRIVSWCPATGFRIWLSNLPSSTSVGNQFLLTAINVFFAYLHVRNYSVQQSVPITRLQALWNFLHPQRLIHLIILSLSGCLFIFCLTQLLGGEIANLEDQCNGDDCSTSGINGQHLFVLLYGIYCGGVYSFKYFRNGWYLVKCPVIQQTKFLTIKSSISEILTDSVLQVLKNLHWYYALYFIFGSYPKHWLSVIIGTENSSVSSFNEIFNLTLLVTTIGCGTTLYFIWNLYLNLFNVCITERHEFSVTATVESEKDKVLPKAIAYSDFDILKYLAFQDLKVLSQNSPLRRSQLFCISQPGGHPYLWEAVSSVCITNLENFLCKLNELSTSSMTNTAKAPTTQTPFIGTPLSPSRSGLTVTSPFTSPGSVSYAPAQKIYFSPINPGLITDSGIGIANYFMTSLKKIQEAIRKKPVVCYFLNEIQDSKARRLFSSCQPVIWMIEALSFLITASYKEDRYGVVQRSFPQILCLLIDLKLSEEKLQLGTISVRRYGKESSSLQKETLFRHSLKSVLNSALYRIVITFKKHISGIHVPEEYQRHIKRYMDFKE